MSTVETPDWSLIPAPIDDGATRHLLGARMASVPLQATNGEIVELSSLRARGCTPQTCSFRDHFAELKALGVHNLFGLSTQSPDYQREAVDRLHLPFAILSDEQLTLTRAMNLPTFETSEMTLLKRFTLVIDDGKVEHVFYPVFPPDRSAADVIEWLRR
jgi:peroxiredoxin